VSLGTSIWAARSQHTKMIESATGHEQVLEVSYVLDVLPFSKKRASTSMVHVQSEISSLRFVTGPYTMCSGTRRGPESSKGIGT
jgi:hypothetical protein